MPPQPLHADDLARLQRLMTAQLETCEQMLRGMARLVERVEQIEMTQRGMTLRIESIERALTSPGSPGHRLTALEARLATLEAAPVPDR